MPDAEWVAFLEWALPRLRLRWAGFRKVRGQVVKRVARRLGDLGLRGTAAYRCYLEAHPEEWAVLDELCRIPISRFWRDRSVFEYLAREALPKLAASPGEDEVRAWSIGCAGGEEVYSLTILWRLELQAHFPDVTLRVLGTDADPRQLARAQAACYASGSLKELPANWRQAACEQTGGGFCVREEFRAVAEFLQQDIRREWPGETFHLVLCRNLVFTYFAEELQRKILCVLQQRLVPGGILVLGKHETLPPGVTGFAELSRALRIYANAAG